MTAKLLNVGRKLQGRVREFFDAAPDAKAPPLELLQAALDQLERKIQPSGRGGRTFPYNRVVVHVDQPNADRPAIEAVFAQLPARLRERCAEMRCELPGDFDARVAITTAAGQNGPVLWLECHRDADEAEATDEDRGDVSGAPALTTGERPRPELRLSVLTGACEQPEYTFQTSVIAIGRGADPADTLGRVRRNHVAFLDARDGVSETVARAHARLEFDPAIGAYLLFNESSSNPTFIRRDGRSLRIAPRDPRGVRVQTGDELQLGRAVLKLALG